MPPSPGAGAHAWPCHGPRDVMDVDVPLVWSLLGCANDCQAPNTVGHGDGDGSSPVTPLWLLDFSISRSVSRQRRRFTHLEVCPSKHWYPWSFTTQARALGVRIWPEEEKHAPSYALDHGTMGG